MFTEPFGSVHNSDMIGRYTHTRKQANLFFPLFSFFFLFYTNRTGPPRKRRAGSVFLTERTGSKPTCGFSAEGFFQIELCAALDALGDLRGGLFVRKIIRQFIRQDALDRFVAIKRG